MSDRASSKPASTNYEDSSSEKVHSEVDDNISDLSFENQANDLGDDDAEGPLPPSHLPVDYEPQNAKA
jgi:hypothetical protein